MALEERIYEDDEGMDAHTHNARQFYFIKVNGSFIEPSLDRKMKNLKRNIEYLKEQKPLLLMEKKLLKDPSLIKYLLNADRNLYSYYSGHYWAMRRAQKTAKKLVNLWSIDEDPKDTEDPDTELLEVESKLETLMYRWKHHLNRNVAEEKRKIRETQPLQERKEKLIKDLKDAEARTPPRKQRDYWHKDDNYKCYLRRKLRERLTPELRNFLERERELDRRSVETSLVNVDSQLIAETESMMALQKDIKKQAAHYNEDIKRAKELALTKDTVGLEELSCKQVEKIMSEWNSKEAFRANYKASVANSLRKRGLSADGRILDHCVINI